MFGNVTALEGLLVTGKCRDRSTQRTCSRRAAWDPPTNRSSLPSLLLLFCSWPRVECYQSLRALATSPSWNYFNTAKTRGTQPSTLNRNSLRRSQLKRLMLNSPVTCVSVTLQFALCVRVSGNRVPSRFVCIFPFYSSRSRAFVFVHQYTW